MVSSAINAAATSLTRPEPCKVQGSHAPGVVHGGARVMGRTVLPFSKVLEQEVQEWKKFRRGLRKEDQQFLDRLFEGARLHVQAGVYASRPWPFETILISILLEHEKALVELKLKLRALEEKKEEGGR
jgi:hypothetical protein